MEAGRIFGDSPRVHLDFRGLMFVLAKFFGLWGDQVSPEVAPETPPGRAAGVLGRRRGDQGGPGRCEGQGAGGEGPEDRDPQREQVVRGRRTRPLSGAGSKGPQDGPLTGSRAGAAAGGLWSCP